MAVNLQGLSGRMVNGTLVPVGNSPIALSGNIQGGLRTVDDQAELLAMTGPFVQDGMLIYQSDTSTYYKFNMGSLTRNAGTGAFNRALALTDFEEIQFDVDSITVSSGDNDPLPRTGGSTGTTPANPHQGDLYINSVSHALWYYVGGTTNMWVNSQGITEATGDARYVRYDAATTYTDAQQGQARSNIGAGTSSVDTITDLSDVTFTERNAVTAIANFNNPEIGGTSEAAWITSIDTLRIQVTGAVLSNFDTGDTIFGTLRSGNFNTSTAEQNYLWRGSVRHIVQDGNNYNVLIAVEDTSSTFVSTNGPAYLDTVVTSASDNTIPSATVNSWEYWISGESSSGILIADRAGTVTNEPFSTFEELVRPTFEDDTVSENSRSLSNITFSDDGHTMTMHDDEGNRRSFTGENLENVAVTLEGTSNTPTINSDTTAGDIRTALGSTTVGDGVFTAADAAAARTILDVHETSRVEADRYALRAGDVSDFFARDPQVNNWTATATYNMGDVVLERPNFYRAISTVAANVRPSATPASWEPLGANAFVIERQGSINTVNSAVVGTGADNLQARDPVTVMGSDGLTYLTGISYILPATLSDFYSTLSVGDYITAHTQGNPWDVFHQVTEVPAPGATGDAARTFVFEALSINTDETGHTIHVLSSYAPTAGATVLFSRLQDVVLPISSDDVSLQPFDNTEGYVGNQLVSFGGEIFRAIAAIQRPNPPGTLPNPVDGSVWQKVLNSSDDVGDELRVLGVRNNITNFEDGDINFVDQGRGSDGARGYSLTTNNDSIGQAKLRKANAATNGYLMTVDGDDVRYVPQSIQPTNFTDITDSGEDITITNPHRDFRQADVDRFFPAAAETLTTNVINQSGPFSIAREPDAIGTGQRMSGPMVNALNAINVDSTDGSSTVGDPYNWVNNHTYAIRVRRDASSTSGRPAILQVGSNNLPTDSLSGLPLFSGRTGFSISLYDDQLRRRTASTASIEPDGAPQNIRAFARYVQILLDLSEHFGAQGAYTFERDLGNGLAGNAQSVTVSANDIIYIEAELGNQYEVYVSATSTPVSIGANTFPNAADHAWELVGTRPISEGSRNIYSNNRLWDVSFTQSGTGASVTMELIFTATFNAVIPAPTANDFVVTPGGEGNDWSVNPATPFHISRQGRTDATQDFPLDSFSADILDTQTFTSDGTGMFVFSHDLRSVGSYSTDGGADVTTGITLGADSRTVTITPAPFNGSVVAISGLYEADVVQGQALIFTATGVVSGDLSVSQRYHNNNILTDLAGIWNDRFEVIDYGLNTVSQSVLTRADSLAWHDTDRGFKTIPATITSADVQRFNEAGRNRLLTVQAVDSVSAIIPNDTIFRELVDVTTTSYTIDADRTFVQNTNGEHVPNDITFDAVVDGVQSIFNFGLINALAGDVTLEGTPRQTISRETDATNFFIDGQAVDATGPGALTVGGRNVGAPTVTDLPTSTTGEIGELFSLTDADVRPQTTGVVDVQTFTFTGTRSNFIGNVGSVDEVLRIGFRDDFDSGVTGVTDQANEIITLAPTNILAGRAEDVRATINFNIYDEDGTLREILDEIVIYAAGTVTSHTGYVDALVVTFNTAIATYNTDNPMLADVLWTVSRVGNDLVLTHTGTPQPFVNLTFLQLGVNTTWPGIASKVFLPGITTEGNSGTQRESDTWAFDPDTMDGPIFGTSAIPPTAFENGTAPSGGSTAEEALNQIRAAINGLPANSRGNSITVSANTASTDIAGDTGGTAGTQAGFYIDIDLGTTTDVMTLFSIAQRSNSNAANTMIFERATHGVLGVDSAISSVYTVIDPAGMSQSVITGMVSRLTDNDVGDVVNSVINRVINSGFAPGYAAARVGVTNVITMVANDTGAVTNPWRITVDHGSGTNAAHLGDIAFGTIVENVATNVNTYSATRTTPGVTFIPELRLEPGVYRRDANGGALTDWDPLTPPNNDTDGRFEVVRNATTGATVYDVQDLDNNIFYRGFYRYDLENLVYMIRRNAIAQDGTITTTWRAWDGIRVDTLPVLRSLDPVTQFSVNMPIVSGG